MNVQQAREWIVQSSLAATGALILFFLLTPIHGFPVEFEEALRLMGTVVPVFVGYLGAAIHRLFARAPRTVVLERNHGRMLNLLVKGPVMLYGLGMAALIASFWYSNRSTTEVGGMTIDALGLGVTALVSLQAGTTGALVMYLFAAEARQ
ncbi:hypothetical protein [Pseudoduganella armeniaca]|uniref:Uncharacterized protein n=1 Tax=Pseudoduganella armeniaca TaxID=2072590 RepID=A0A2R4CAE7_9BURK|nr:hypothetical protein [Pseudoduganella armeniaca]AVR96565.1 hypothetical protein C9I28_13315 [Pseudoduganella armeniaca]